MASTFSTLKFELITTGEQSGTWGGTTNVNIGTAIQEAIAGTVDITFASVDITLSFTDVNTTQSARNLRLNLIGTSGGPQNLVVPTISTGKNYIINNATADAITVKTTAGTGIAVPNGKTMWLYQDGTNVVDVTTHLSSLTLTTDLALADGGTGASTALAARTNLEVGITKEGTAFASATSPTVPTDGNYFDVSAANTITSFSVAANRHFFCNFLAAATLTHNDPNLELPGGANITAAAGDVAEFFSTATDDVQCVNYTRADGTAIAGVTLAATQTWTGPQRGGVTDIGSQGTTVTVDLTASNNHKCELTGASVTFASPTGLALAAVGQCGSIFINQDSSGGRAASFNAAYQFPGAVAPTLSTGVSANDRLDYIVVSATELQCVVTLAYD
mgnify:CR=1 FL=1